MGLADKHLPVLDAAHRGDPAALAQLLRLCQPDIRRYAQRNCLIGDVDDAVQEALLVLSRKLSSVRMLAADYLQVVLLRDFAEMSIGEIAGETGESVAAVKSRLHRARQMAREYLIG